MMTWSAYYWLFGYLAFFVKMHAYNASTKSVGRTYHIAIEAYGRQLLLCGPLLLIFRPRLKNG
ncbi:hypothetical protein Amal_02781 [Acetobacter malorum]|uniref:Uncharacterized protein n=1 Tax=Acetobacter malorum TaxID=178901 RepID=A0A177G9P3_9PROT|nr:hypothetical protein Amal_02781 [Acetobacter malorum]